MKKSKSPEGRIPGKSGIPVPPAKPGKPAKYPWLELKIGESFEVLGPACKSVGSQASHMGSYHGIRFVTRRIPGGIRVWRVAGGRNYPKPTEESK